MSERNPEVAAAANARPLAGLIDRARLALAADWLAVVAAMSLPWSTSLSGILIALWLIVVLPTLDIAMVRRELMTPEGGLPVLLWVIAALGMLWADVAWQERLDGLGGFHKLLMIPLLLAQFRRSGHGRWVVRGFFVSAAVLLVLSWGLALIPGLPWRGHKNTIGVPVKDYIIQSEIFAICALGLLWQAAELWRQRRRERALLLVGAAAMFIANVFYVATGRTTLVILAALLLLFGLRQIGWKGAIAACVIGGILAGLVWTSSPYLRNKVESVDSAASTGQRLDFWKYSIPFIAEAPVIGHGTGMIESVFERARSVDPAVPTTRNPHGQIFTVGIQLGLLGTAMLFAMWFAHLALFREATLTAWLGLTVVAGTIVGSMFNSHLSDFTQGWIYAFGVGVVGAMVGRRAGDQAPGF